MVFSFMEENQEITQPLKNSTNDEKSNSNAWRAPNMFADAVGQECYINVLKYNRNSGQLIDALEDMFSKMDEQEKIKTIQECKLKTNNNVDFANSLLKKGEDYFNNSLYGSIQKAGGIDAYIAQYDKRIQAQEEEIKHLREEKKQDKVLASKEEIENTGPVPVRYPVKNPFHVPVEKGRHGDEIFANCVLKSL